VRFRGVAAFVVTESNDILILYAGLMIDPDQAVESPFFNTRQLFLNLCQGNHYQFDQLRRAKHSSMMILWYVVC
jgi:hypothetical protein